MKLILEGYLKDEETDDVYARISSYSIEGFEGEIRKLESKLKQLENEENN